MINKSIGSKLLELRKDKGWSQEQTADYLKVSRSTYQRIETGEGNSWAGYIEKICEVFEITPEELVSHSNIILNNSQNGGTSNNALVINQLSEKLIEQYENHLKEKGETIAQLKEEVAFLRSQLAK